MHFSNASRKVVTGLLQDACGSGNSGKEVENLITSGAVTCHNYSLRMWEVIALFTFIILFKFKLKFILFYYNEAGDRKKNLHCAA